ncbi:ABC transporter permease subunit [Naasia sp. SYSU D00948]|uniref:ABC transporter permease subunit n=1 Tax=Naasia sp. SYSU D00948 TaxID=2817379 RepID=UPI001B312E1F|nr:ABC transporter permease subunit [Naasia sp. SYSU D00948]
MSTLTSTPTTHRVSLPHLLHAEWIKAATVNATRWTTAVTLALAAFFAGTVLLVIGVAPLEGEDPSALILENFGERPALSVLSFTFAVVPALVALLGLLLVSGERGTGTLAVTLAAVPRRTPVLVAKLLLSAAAGFVVGLLAAGVTIAVVQPGLAGIGLGDGLWTAVGAQVVLGGAVSSAAIAVLGTALGSLFRNTAGAAGAVLSLLLIAPVILPMIPVIGSPLSQVLPTSAAAALSQPIDTVGGGTLLTGGLILAAWVAVSAVVATVLWKRRDI